MAVLQKVRYPLEQAPTCVPAAMAVPEKFQAKGMPPGTANVESSAPAPSMRTVPGSITPPLVVVTLYDEHWAAALPAMPTIVSSPVAAIAAHVQLFFIFCPL